MASLKKNILYSSLLAAANHFFPLLTFPYVSRVLGVANIGICNFVDSIINYFILFSMLGITTVGVREISQVKSDRHELNRTFSRIFTINALTTAAALVFLVISIFTVPQLRANQEFMWIGALKLIGNFLLVEWLYKGLEEFRYITTRSVAVKTIFVAAVFLLIKSPDDTALYYFLLTMMIVMNAAVNIFCSRKHVHFGFMLKGSSPLFMAIAVLGIYALLTSMYTTFNVVYLGFTHSDVEVGYYTTGSKIYRMVLAVFTAVTGAMMPRLSALLSEKRFGEFRLLLGKSFRILLAVFIPVSAITCIFAPQIIHIIAGSGYEGAVLPLRIISPLFVIIGIEQILIIQGLMPMKKDRAVLTNSLVGAAVGLSANLILVPRFGAVGAALAWLLAECTVLSCAAFSFSRAMKKIPTSDN